MTTYFSKLALAAAFAGTVFATPALAEPILLDGGDIGESFTIKYDGFSNGTTISGLTAETTFTLTGVTDTTYSFDYVVSNTTSGDVGSRVSSFAFNTNPDIASASSTGDYSFVVTDSNYPNGVGNVDVCFKGGNSGSCAGNTGGAAAGETGMGTLTLNFADPLASLTLDDFFVRYQSVTGAGTVSSASGQQVSSSSGGTRVPEPGMLGILGVSLIGLGLARRRQSRGMRPA